MKRLALLVALSCLAGCQVGVTESDTANVQQEFSQANYEAAMKAAGKGAELEREQQAAAARGE